MADLSMCILDLQIRSADRVVHLLNRGAHGLFGFYLAEQYLGIEDLDAVLVSHARSHPLVHLDGIDQARALVNVDLDGGGIIPSELALEARHLP